MKSAFTIILLVLFIGKSFAQIKDSIGFTYYSYKYEEIIGGCNAWEFDKNPQKIKNICGLGVWNKENLNFFLKNIQKFKHIKAISLSQVNIQDFDFLEELPNLEFVSMVKILDLQNISSFVTNMNKNKNIYLLNLLFNEKRFPKELNELQNIRAIEIEESNISYFKIDLNLKQLIISDNNKKIKYLQADNTEYISLRFNKLKSIPKGLSVSESLKGLEFSDYTDYKIECPIPGFEKLEIFSAFGAKGLKVSRDCFENKGVKEVWGNIYEEYPLNEANEKND